MDVVSRIRSAASEALAKLYDLSVAPDELLVNPTKKEFEGDLTLVVFPFVKQIRKKPEQIGAEIGEQLKERTAEIDNYNVIKGFLNLELSETFWVSFLQGIWDDPEYGQHPGAREKVMVEYSSPNTNKPLHLGHIRNILLGWSCSRILEAAGHEVIKTQIVNDRGIAICRSMVAWENYGKNKTPESERMKGDHFVGHYYVEFARQLKKEYEAWQQSTEGQQVFRERKKQGQDEEAFFNAYKNQYFNEFSGLGAQAREMLLKWEAGDPQVRALWQMMNGWVYEGFDQTYEKLGVHFDKIYYESDTYLLGKEQIEKGLEKGIFQKDGQRIWIDLEDAKLGHKTIIKSDGTSTYTSQDLGTAHIRYTDYGVKRMVYVVGEEQINHFQVLFEIIKRLEEPYADGLYHLSYGMVDLPTGRMKSREGTVVDADDLIEEVIREAAKASKDSEEVALASPEEKQDIIRKIGLAALKYFILKVNPKKRMIFNPEESVDLHGHTGPYIQYSYVRARKMIRKGMQDGVNMQLQDNYEQLEPAEKNLLRIIRQYPETVSAAAEAYDPSEIANYNYELAKDFNRFYQEVPVLSASTEAAKAFRLAISQATCHILAHSMDLLGIEMPERM